MKGVLYYPYINVPDEAWFTRLLLYWESVGAIVPSSYATGGDRLKPHMQQLVDSELLERVVPEAYEGQLFNGVGDFLRALLDDVEEATRQGRSLEASLEQPRFQIHSGKLGPTLLGELQHRGLAVRARGEGSHWYAVHPFVGARVMSFVATTLGACTDLSPITDRESMLGGFAPAVAAGDSIQKVVDSMRPTVLNRILPAPSEPVSVAEIVRFKERHGDELQRFRRTIEDMLIRTAAIPDAAARDQLVDHFMIESSEGIAEIQANMKRHGWRRTAIGALLIAGPIAAVAAAPLAVAGLVGFPGAVYSVWQTIRPSGDWKNKPLAYAALASETFASR